MKKIWKLIIILIIAGVVGGYYYYSSNKPISVRTYVVEKKNLTIFIEEDGICKPKSDLFIQSEYGGTVKKILAVDGSMVKKGQMLFVFDASEMKYQVNQLSAEKESIAATRELELEKLAVDKLAQLYAAGGISQKEYEDALAVAQSSYYPAQIKALDASINQVKVRMGKTVVRAPFAGKVIMEDAAPGQVFLPGQNICRLIDNSKIKYEAYVLADDAVGFSVGGKAYAVFEAEGKETSIPAHVTYIAPIADEKISPLGLKERRTRVLLVSDEESRLNYPGRELRIKFIRHIYDRITVVPKTAVFRYDNGDALWIVRDGKAYIQKITTGADDGNVIIVTSGIKEKDVIIDDPMAYQLQEGIKIGA